MNEKIIETMGKYEREKFRYCSQKADNFRSRMRQTFLSPSFSKDDKKFELLCRSEDFIKKKMQIQLSIYLTLENYGSI